MTRVPCASDFKHHKRPIYAALAVLGTASSAMVPIPAQNPWVAAKAFVASRGTAPGNGMFIFTVRFNVKLMQE
jgi:hypothetical protein